MSEVSIERRRRPGSAAKGVTMFAAILVIQAAISVPAGAESSPEGTTVLSVRAGSACIKEEIRITGFALAREEGGASVPFENYRISDILVSEGDSVTSGQELMRAVRLGDDPGTSTAPRPSAYALRSPMAGKITRINARVGMTTTVPAASTPSGMPPEPQVRIMADAGIDLLVDVPSLFATKVRTGLVARVLADGSDEIKGTVRVPVSEVDPATQLGRARLTIEPSTGLRPGQFASAILETARDCGLSVPRSAVSYQNGSATVQVLKGNSVETRSVRTGLFDENTIQIRDGLVDGEPVVANAGTALRSGDRVTPFITER